MRLDKDRNVWLISGMDNNTMFGSSLTSPADLSITSSDIALSQIPGMNARVIVTVHNAGGMKANNIRVDIYKKGPLDADYALMSTQTILAINGNSQASTNAADTAVSPGLNYFKAIVDPNNTLGESDVLNNTAINSITIV